MVTNARTTERKASINRFLPLLQGGVDGGGGGGDVCVCVSFQNSYSIEYLKTNESEACTFIKKETLVLSCKFCDTFPKTFLTGNLRATASVPSCSKLHYCSLCIVGWLFCFILSILTLLLSQRTIRRFLY